MTTDRDAIRRFFRLYDVSPVGATPVQPNIPPDDEEKDAKETVDLSVEESPDAWNPSVVSEAPARDGEFPTRFIDGSQAGQPVLCVRAPLGWPIPLVLSVPAMRIDVVRFMAGSPGFDGSESQHRRRPSRSRRHDVTIQSQEAAVR